MIYRELDDLKMIVGNCFEQLGKSVTRQIDVVRQEASAFQRAAEKDPANASFGTKQRGLNKSETGMDLLMSPKGAAKIDIANIEVLNKI